jgi:malic enzyme
MLRRNFLRNATFTLPVALAAPGMLFAGNNKALKKAKVIIIGAGHAGLYVASQLAASDTDMLLLEPGSGTAADAWYNVPQQDSSIPATGKMTDHAALTAASFDREKTVTGKHLVKISCSSKGFTLTDNHGDVYATDKVVFATPVEFSQAKAMVHINTAAARQLSVSINKNGSTSAQCWAAPAAGINEQLLTAFTGSSKPAILCIS